MSEATAQLTGILKQYLEFELSYVGDDRPEARFDVEKVLAEIGPAAINAGVARVGEEEQVADSGWRPLDEMFVKLQDAIGQTDGGIADLFCDGGTGSRIDALLKQIARENAPESAVAAPR